MSAAGGPSTTSNFAFLAAHDERLAAVGRLAERLGELKRHGGFARLDKPFDGRLGELSAGVWDVAG